MMGSISSRCALIVAAAVTPLMMGCLSSNPPIDVRVFDPGPRARELLHDFDPPAEAISVKVLGGPGLRREMLWRVSDVEVAYDALHQWSVEPAVLVRATLESVFPVPADRFTSLSAGPWVCEVVAFDNVVEPRPAARLHVRLRPDQEAASTADSVTRSARPMDIVVVTNAASDAPQDMARAMAQNLADMTRQLATRCALAK